MGFTLSDRFYWFRRNLWALILNLIVLPVYMVMFVLESIYDGFKITFTVTDGSETLQYPWENEWPFFREDC